MGIRETRLARGQERGRRIVRNLAGELAEARKLAGVSQATLAGRLGWSQSEVSRLERVSTPDSISFVDVAEVASMLGVELSAGLHLVGDPIRDEGHLTLITRFRALLSPVWRVTAEVPLPNSSDLRCWDLLLRLNDQLVGVEAETRVRDMQALTRHVHLRERDGGADVIVVLLAATRTNRALASELRRDLGAGYATPAGILLGALRGGRNLPGSGVILL